MAIRTPLSKQQLEVLMDEAQSLKGGFDYVHDHVIITDENANILYVNPAVSKHTGFTREETIGKNPGDLWGGQMPKEFYRDMWEVIKIRKKPFVGQVQNIKKDGTRYWQEVHIYPLIGNKDEVKFFIGIEPDITERVEKEQFQKEFTRIVGHQLLPPLTMTKWFTEDILSERQALSVEQVEKLNKLYASNESLISLVSDLLALAKSEDSKMQQEKVDLVKEITTIIENTKTKNPKVTIEFTQEGDNLFVEENKSVVLQVLSNLINNATEYAAKEEGHALITLKRDNTGITFSSENNGLVIPKEEQGKIFSKLFRTSNAKEYKEEGSGLGLFIVKMICDKLGWKVWFESPRKEGNGAIFFVKLK
jgi:PAS domain S-box-containing protein